MTLLGFQRASAPDRERMLELFVRLCEIESPSGRERGMADAVAAELRGLGLEVQEDESAGETGSDAGNLLARLPGPDGARTILLCAHLDTVPLDAPVEVVRDDGVFRNRNEAILGADNKAAVATILAAVRRLAAGGPPVGLELLFTTCEERALRGAKAFDRSRLRSEFGFVFDHASPIGELIVAAPTYYRIEARFRGAAAHAGIRPEEGRNAIAAAARAVAAMRLGRLDEGRAGELVGEMVDALQAAASDAECDLETEVERLFQGYRLPRTSASVEVAAEALQAVGIEARPIATGGGSDANALVAAGLPVLNVANGTERNHQPDESVSAWALETMLDVTLGIVAASAR